MSNRCPACFSRNTQETDSLTRECLDCREVYDPTVDDGDRDEEPDCDDSDDGQALASAGWGTDEDYGLHEDWFDERND